MLQLLLAVAIGGACFDGGMSYDAAPGLSPASPVVTSGNLTLPSTGRLVYGTRGSVGMASDGKLQLLNNAGSIDGTASQLNGILFGSTTNTGAYLTYLVSYTMNIGASTATTSWLNLRNGDNSSYASLGVGDFSVAGNSFTALSSAQARMGFSDKTKIGRGATTGRFDVYDFSDNFQFTVAEGLISTTISADWNTTNKTTLFTVPSGKSAVVTKVVVRGASTSLTTASCAFGFNANADDWKGTATFTELTASALLTAVSPKVGAAVGSAAAVFGTKCTIAQGGAATVNIDVFGYFF